MARTLTGRSTTLSQRLRRAWLLFAAVLLGGCAKPAPPRPEDLAYPVLVLFAESGAVAHRDRADLSRMSLQRILNAHDAPMLVDSRLDVYRLVDLQSTHNFLWQMANPVGHTDVEFKMERVAEGDAARVRALIEEREVGTRHADDRAQRLARLAQAPTLQAMMVAVGIREP